MSESEQVVGRVAQLWRYPVKSMAGEPLQEADVSWDGLAGDRRWAFVRPGLERSGFPWLTLRERRELALHRPSLADPARPDASPAVVRTPDGRTLDVADPALAAALGDGVRVMKQERGTFDASTLSLVTTGSVARLGAVVGAPLDVRRFRPNLVVEAARDEPFAEEGWIGGVLRVGSALLRADRRDRRCTVVGVDPVTTAHDPAVLRAIARERGAHLGIYATTVEPGRVAVGDLVVLERGPA